VTGSFLGREEEMILGVLILRRTGLLKDIIML